MTIKKNFQGLVDLLNANLDKKVKSVMNDVLALVETKTRGSSANVSYRDPKTNKIVAIFDYYFKQWMPLSHVEFGVKVSSGTGYNPMSKEGALNWSRQQTAARKAEAQLLNDAISGNVDAEEMGEIKTRIEAERTTIIPHSAGIGFDTIDELLEADDDELDALVNAVQTHTEAEDTIQEDQAEAA